MAKPAKKSETKITRIKASESEAPAAKNAAEETPAAPTKVNSDKKTAKLEKKTEDKPAKESKGNVFVRIGRYFKGAWSELRQVRWPDRKATWGMTGALIAFTLFFVVVILVLDFGFSELFKLILGSN